MLLSMKKGVFKYYIRILWGVGGVQVHRENVKTITFIFSKGKSGIRRSSTETCEGYSDFRTTSMESHTGFSTYWISTPIIISKFILN